MNEKEEKELLDLIQGLKNSEMNDNKIQKEFCGALLYKYIQDGVDIYEYANKEEIEKLINEGLELFLKRKRKFYLKRMFFNLFTAIACFLFSYFYLLLAVYKSLVVLIVAFLIESIIKSRVNKIVFVAESKKIYSNYVPKSLLHIRESEDNSKLWI